MLTPLIAQLSSLLNTETVLFVDDDDPESVVADVVREQRVGTHHDVDASARQSFETGRALLALE